MNSINTIVTANIHQSIRAKGDKSAQREVSMATSFWDESQIQAVIRHAASKGLSPEEFFNKKWKRVLCSKRG